MQNIELTQDHIVKIMLTYDQLKNLEDESNFNSGAMQGIQLVLDVLGIYIDGVNWNPDKEVIENVENNETNGN